MSSAVPPFLSAAREASSSLRCPNGRLSQHSWLLTEFVRLMRSCEQPGASSDIPAKMVFSFLSDFGGASKETPCEFAASVLDGAWPDDRFIVFVVNYYLKRPVHVLRRGASGSAYVRIAHLHSSFIIAMCSLAYDLFVCHSLLMETRMVTITRGTFFQVPFHPLLLRFSWFSPVRTRRATLVMVIMTLPRLLQT